MTVTANADGLRQRYGLDTQRQALTGEVRTAGMSHELLVLLDAGRAPLNSTTVGFVGEPNNAIPAGAYIEDALLVVTTAFDSAGDAATLGIGTAEADGTPVDADGIDVAIAESAIDTAGKEIACDGAQVGAVLATTSYVTVTVGTEKFTSGEGYLRIRYTIPPVVGAS
jgi:hypothetical protein